MRVPHLSYLMATTVLAHAALGQVINIPQSDLQPSGNPGTISWVPSDAGLSGPLTLKIIAEVTGTAVANSLLLDIQNNGFPAPPAGGVTDDVVIFGPAAVPGATAVVEIPPGAQLALFHDVYDETGGFLSGPDGILKDNPQPGTDDAYLSSNTLHNFTIVGRQQLVKYFLADPTKSYKYTSQWGTVTQLDSGYHLFLFMDDDHSPSYDYDDMIIGVVAQPCVDNSQCVEGDTCISTQVCLQGYCQNGCYDGQFCDGIELCISGQCVSGPSPTCNDGVACTIDSCGNNMCSNTPSNASCPDDGLFCNGAELCDIKMGCRSGGNPCPANQFCNESLDACLTCASNIDCDDGNFCNGAERCVKGICMDSSDPSCDDGDDCTSDGCDEGGCFHLPVEEGSFCDDDDPCTVDDACLSGVCEGVEAYGIEVWPQLAACMAGPDVSAAEECTCPDVNDDHLVDLIDTAILQNLFTP